METTITTKTITYWDRELQMDFTKEMELVGKRKIYAEYHGKDQWKNIFVDRETNKYYAKSGSCFYEVYLEARRMTWRRGNPNGEVWRNSRYEISKCRPSSSKNLYINYEYKYDRVLDKYIFNNNEFKDHNSLQLYVDAYDNKYGHLKSELEKYKNALQKLDKLSYEFNSRYGDYVMFHNSEASIEFNEKLNEMIDDCKYCIEQIGEMLK